MRLSTALKGAAAVAALVAVVMISATKSVDFERYKGYLSELVLAETGRKLSFGGPVKLRLGLVPSLIAEKVSLSNVAGGSRAEMITIERVEAEVALPALLRKEILIQRLIVSGPDIVLEKGNWRLVDQGDSGKAATPTRFNLRELKVKNGIIRWAGENGMQQMALHKLVVVPEQGAGAGLGVNVVGDALGKTFEMTGKLGNLGAALGGKHFPVSLKGAMPGTIVSLDGSVAALADFSGLDFKLGLQADEMAELLRMASGRNAGSLGPLRLTARLSDAGGVLGLSAIDASAGRRDTLFVSAKGAVRDLRALSGIDAVVQMESDDTGRLSSLLGLEIPAWRAVRLSAALRDNPDGWAASDIKLHVGGSDLAGEAVLRHGKRHHVKASLASARLDAADFADKPGTGPGDRRLLPAVAIPVDGLRGHDADIEVKADTLVAGGATWRGVAAKASLHQGVLAVAPAIASLAGGRVEASLTLDTQGKVPAAQMRLDAAEVDFGRLLREAGSDMLHGGSGSLALSLRGQGADLRAMAAGADGSVLLRVGGGEVRNRAFGWAGADILSQVLGILNPLAQSRDITRLTCAVAHFRLKGGVAASDRGIAVQADGTDVVGSGSIRLADESLDLGFTPRAKDGLGLSVGGQLAGLTRLRGTLAAPQVTVDEIGAAKTALSVGAAAATGGLSFLGELLLDKVTADSEPCRTALAMGTQSPKKGGGGFLEGLFGR